MSEQTFDQLRELARTGVESYKEGYRHGIQEGEQDLALAKLTIEQLQTRLQHAEQHITKLEDTILRVAYPELDEEITDPNADGYRPPFCDKAKSTKCCSGGTCFADAELKEMGKL
jgi:chromosome segregation ATPase